MKKKIGIWLAACLLLLTAVPLVPVSAAPDAVFEAKLISGYCLGSELYAFVSLDDSYREGDFTVTLQSDAVTSGDEARLELLTDTNTTVRYVFMIDNSGSMSEYEEEVNSFLGALCDSEQQKATYTIATFGEGFEVECEDITDKNTLQKKLKELSYDEKYTDPYTGVESAITYLDSYSRKSGDLVNLIVITDGEPDLGIDDEAEAAEKEALLAASLAEQINSTPEVIISTLCTAEWEETAIDALSNGKGIHKLLDSTRDAVTAGQEMAAYVDGLYRTSLKLSAEPQTERFSLSLTMNGRDANGTLVKNNMDIENLPNLRLFSNSQTEEVTVSGENGTGLILPGETAQENTEGTEISTEQDDTENAESDTEQKKSDSDDEDEDEEEPGDEKSTFSPLLIIISICCVIVAALICFFMLIKKKQSEQAPAAQQGKTGGIPMKLEVLAGNCQTTATTLYLSGELYIGSGPGCDITFADPMVAPHHARIARKDNGIVLEDMNSPTGTYLGGMRIQGSNRLRSGDVISVGDSDFSLKF